MQYIHFRTGIHAWILWARDVSFVGLVIGPGSFQIKSVGVPPIIPYKNPRMKDGCHDVHGTISRIQEYDIIYNDM